MTKAFLTSILLFSIPSWAANPHDDYYSGDIFEAIEEAKKRPHHYDYSSQKRYNRTTTQSIEIPKLLNREMAGMSIESRGSGTPESSALDTYHDNNEEDSLKRLNNLKSTGVSNKGQQVQTVPLNMNPNVNNQGSISVISRP